MGNILSATTIEEIEVDEKIKHQRHLLLKQIKNSKVKLRKPKDDRTLKANLLIL
jgi:hypothetical protein